MSIQQPGYKIEHIGIVVHDVEKSAVKLGDYLNIRDWKIRTNEPPALYDTMFRGQKVFHSFKIAMAQLNGIGIELLMPIKGESVYTEFLREKGEGFHHICYLFSREVELEKMKNELRDKGGKVIQSGKVKEKAQYCYIEKDGMVLELLARK